PVLATLHTLPGPVLKLTAQLLPVGDGDPGEVRLQASDRDGRPLAAARLDGVAGAALTGGIALVSSSTDPTGGARHWFAGLGTAGAKLASRPERAEGPVLATLHTLNGQVLKLTAQLLPVGDGDPGEVRLQLRRPGTDGWEDKAAAPVGPGFAAAFRVTDWDGAAERGYRVLWGAGTAEEQAYEGTVAADPAGGARHWFAGLGTAGAKLASRPERAEGPVLATLHTLNGPVLKLTAQLLPVGERDPRDVLLQVRHAGGAWEDKAVAPVGPGFAAAFRVTGWDGAAERPYRVLWGAGTAEEQAY
ncbi:MAG TPA: hypothetical protein VG411_13850, partial [Actinomycetota bacterium]|nr:hypothetical protein [Actinomycetota bacterium]